MIRLAVIAAALLLAGVAVAQQRAQPRAQPARPAQQEIGRFDDWIAYVTDENGQKICYMGTKARSSAPALSGRTDVVLSVTHRPGSRDQVAILAGYAYPSGAEVAVTVDGSTTLPFYTGGRAAFARDGRAAAAAFRRGNEATAKGPPARGPGQVTDTFSLRGFTAAHEAIGKACPAR